MSATEGQKAAAKRYYCVDHDHGTGKVRGLLCRECNKSLGGFHDSTELLARAMEYLKRSTCSL